MTTRWKDSLSVIIPASDGHRLDNLCAVLGFLARQTFKWFEVVLVEQAVKDEQYELHYQHMPGVDRYIPLVNHHNELFCKTWCMNVGARFARGDRYLFLDVDAVSDENYLEAVFNQEGPWFVGWSEYYFCSDGTTKEIYRTGRVVLPASAGNGCSTLGACGLAVAYDAEFFWNKLGGHNEAYFAWGAEDNDSVFRATNLTKKFLCMKYKMLHLAHTRKKIYVRNDNNHLFWMCQHYPQTITDRLVKAGLGNIGGPTIVDIKDLKP